MASTLSNSQCYFSIESNDEEIKRYTISQRQAFLIQTTTEWVVDQTKSHLDSHRYSSELVKFKKVIEEFLRARFQRLGCANIRTIGSNAQLYNLASKAKIPHEALPQNISIIVNREMCYYFKGDSSKKHMIISH